VKDGLEYLGERSEASSAASGAALNNPANESQFSMNRIYHYHSPFPEARLFLAHAKELKTLTMNQLTKIQICSNAS